MLKECQAAVVIPKETYVPCYESNCENCEQTPTVTVHKNGKENYRFDMCGPCTFGTAQALDVDWWNS